MTPTSVSVGGGNNNIIFRDSSNTVIAGGKNNRIGVDADHSTIGGNVFAESEPTHFTVRWFTSTAQNFMVTLFPDGGFRFDYGGLGATRNAPIIGYSAGNFQARAAIGYNAAENRLYYGFWDNPVSRQISPLDLMIYLRTLE